VLSANSFIFTDHVWGVETLDSNLLLHESVQSLLIKGILAAKGLEVSLTNGDAVNRAAIRALLLLSVVH